MIKIIYSIKVFFYIIPFLKLIIVKGSKLDIDRIGDTVEARYEIPLIRHRISGKTLLHDGWGNNITQKFNLYMNDKDQLMK
jgi:hypothetical protein